MTPLKGKVAIVTGGSRGIGRAIVLKLASLGVHVEFNYHASKDAAKTTEEKARKTGIKCQASCVNIKDFEGVKAWVDQVKERHEHIDILVNNAGVITDKALMMMAQEDWQHVVDTNLNGMFNISRACIVSFMKQKSGHIVNISSVSGIIGLDRQSNYSATKGGMNAFTKALAKEVAGHGVRVNAVAPGFIETDMLANFNEEQKKAIAESIPLKRIGTPEDVAHCVAFLLSQEAQYMTGQIIQVDGGLAMR